VKRVRVVLAILLIGALIAALMRSQYTTEPFHVSGFIEADDVRVGSRVGGRVLRVHVEEGQHVQVGALLVELEPFDLEEQVAEAKALRAGRAADLARLLAGYRPQQADEARARRDQRQAELQQLVHGPLPREIAKANAQVKLAEAEYELAKLENERAKRLLERKTVSRQELDRTTRGLRVAEAKLEVRKQELGLLREGTRAEQLARGRAALAQAEAALALVESGYRAETIAAAKASLAAADAAIAALGRRLEELRIRAPTEGLVEAVELRPGDLVAPNAPVLSLIDPGSLWVRAYVPEQALSIRIGDGVEVSVDAFPGKRFPGRISYVARQAEFTPRNVQTPEERSKQVFRIKVTLGSGADGLRAGMAADVWFDGAGAR